MRRTAAALLLFAALGCHRAAEKTPPATKAAAQSDEPAEAPPDLDADNLLNLAYGAGVVSRTGEANLEYSAVQAIDGLANTYWSSPPGGARQMLVFSLFAPARIERLGVTGFQEAKTGRIRFAASLDGSTWREVAVQSPAPSNQPQIEDVKPFEARFLRVETVDPAESYAYFRSVHALGAELARPAPRRFEGCWTINGAAARLVQNGARVTGVIATEPPTFLDGGTNGRVLMLQWSRKPNRGYALATIDPDARTFSGLTIYDDISGINSGAAWLGSACDGAPTANDVRSRSFAADRGAPGPWSLYGLAFDASDDLVESLSASTLDELASVLRENARFRIVSYELRMDAPQRRTTQRIASLRAALEKRGVDFSRVELVSAGAKWRGPTIVSALQRVLASRVDLERVGR